MGRKTNKEKRMKRKAEKKEIKQEESVMSAKQVIVDAANKIGDPMSMLLPFQKFERNGLRVSIAFHRSSDLDDDTKEWVYALTKKNMQKLYENSGWGWNETQKREELFDEAACYLVARDMESNKPVALVHFRFDMDYDDAVLYCYEIQLEVEVRRKGLGKFLMQILELLANKTDMEKVMLTVFKDNEEGNKFFREILNYGVDETNPEETLAEKLFEENATYSYQILSKKTLNKRKPLVPHQHNNAAGHHVHGVGCC